MDPSYSINVSIPPELESKLRLSGGFDQLRAALNSAIASAAALPEEHLDLMFTQATRVRVSAYGELQMSDAQRNEVQDKLSPILLAKLPMDAMGKTGTVSVGIELQPDRDLRVIPNGALHDMIPEEVEALRIKLQPILMETSPMKELIGNNGLLTVIGATHDQQINH